MKNSLLRGLILFLLVLQALAESYLRCKCTCEEDKRTGTQVHAAVLIVISVLVFILYFICR